MFLVQVTKYKSIIMRTKYDIGKQIFLYHTLYMGDENEKNKNNIDIYYNGICIFSNK